MWRKIVETAIAIAPRRVQLSLLRRKIELLEAEVQEAHRLNRRVAEIADVVQELLVPAADRDDERIRELLEDYRPSSSV